MHAPNNVRLQNVVYSNIRIAVELEHPPPFFMLYIIIILLNIAVIVSLFYLTQKCKERVKALQTDDERLKKWMNVMVNDFMSSEESCEEDDTFVIRPLPWRSFKVNEFFGRLDTTSKTHRSSQSRKMRNGRH